MKSKIPPALGLEESIDRPASRAEIYFAGAGEGYTANHPVFDYAKQRAEKYPDREIYVLRHYEGFRAPRLMQDLNRRNVPIDVVTYSWGTPTGMSAIQDSGAEVGYLASIDPVGRFESVGGVRPGSIGRWDNVTASLPETGPRSTQNRSDVIASVGGKPSALPVEQADRSIDVTTNHSEFPFMMRRSGVEARLDDHRSPTRRRSDGGSFR
jgi:hypothetical protein